MIVSVCGLRCDQCEFYQKTCEGCKAVEGQTFWAKEMMPNKTCPLYDCSVHKKGYSHCGQCAELPCETFRNMKDPNSTEEEHRLGLIERAERLKGLA